jgi:hypothetical protein
MLSPQRTGCVFIIVIVRAASASLLNTRVLTSQHTLHASPLTCSQIWIHMGMRCEYMLGAALLEHFAEPVHAGRLGESCRPSQSWLWLWFIRVSDSLSSGIVAM